ncbi:MAG: hypothetical protein M3Q72_05800, partial [Actinomycetota bacterium]|nr:hypothetical protein [Actinomycetota bacterium]
AALEPWRRNWTERMQRRYYERYDATLEATRDAKRPALLPDDPVDARLLLDAHVLLNALYEVRYELGNRPHWAAWPLGAVAKMVVERAESS